MSQRHAVPSIRGRELARVHAEDGAHEGQWEENDRDGGEQHDRAALSDRLIGAFERVFRFNDAGLLLLEVQEIFQLRLSAFLQLLQFLPSVSHIPLDVPGKMQSMVRNRLPRDDRLPTLTGMNTAVGNTCWMQCAIMRGGSIYMACLFFRSLLVLQ